MFRISNGREHFFQWDLDQQLVIEDNTITEVHFCNKTDDCSLVCEVYEEDGVRLVNVPNILLQDIWDIRAYAYCSNYTKVEERFKVHARTKPTDYVYTETETFHYNKLKERIVELEEKSIDYIKVKDYFSIPAFEEEFNALEDGKYICETDIRFIPSTLTEYTTGTLDKGCSFVVTTVTETEKRIIPDYMQSFEDVEPYSGYWKLTLVDAGVNVMACRDGKLPTAEDIGALTVEDAANTYSNAIPTTAKGTIVKCTNVSPVEHDIQIKADKDTTVKVYGKNVFSKSEAGIFIGYIQNGALKAGTTTRTFYCPIQPNTTYTLSKKATTLSTIGTTATEPAKDVAVTTFATGTINSTTNIGTFTTGADAKYLVMYFYNSSANPVDNTELENIKNSIQIEVGELATTYEDGIEPIEHKVKAEDTIKSSIPNMTIFCEDEIEVIYNKDAKGYADSVSGKWKLLNRVELEEEVVRFTLNTKDDGSNYDCEELLVCVKIMPMETPLTAASSFRMTFGNVGGTYFQTYNAIIIKNETTVVTCHITKPYASETYRGIMLQSGAGSWNGENLGAIAREKAKANSYINRVHMYCANGNARLGVGSVIEVYGR